MTKQELSFKVAMASGLSHSHATAAVEATIKTICQEMASGNNIYLRGFGTFIVKRRAAKTARNIGTGEQMMLPARNIPAFKPAKSFVNAVKKETEA